MIIGIVIGSVWATKKEEILVVTGSSVRMAPASPNIPIDAAIVGILDEVEITKGL